MTEPKSTTKTKANYAGAAGGVAGAVAILSLFLLGPEIGLIAPSAEDATSAYLQIAASLIGGAVTGGAAWYNAWRSPPNVPVDPKLQLVVEEVADSKTPATKVVGAIGTKVT